MLVWGSGGDSKVCANIRKHCSDCQKECPFIVILQYRYWGVYWIFSFVTEKQYIGICQECDNRTYLNSDEVEARLDDHPIPFIRRWGCLTFAVVIVTMWVLSAVGGC